MPGFSSGRPPSWAAASSSSPSGPATLAEPQPEAIEPGFAGKVGGYVLGFGSAAWLYVGEALRTGAGISVGLVTAALAAPKTTCAMNPRTWVLTG